MFCKYCAEDIKPSSGRLVTTKSNLDRCINAPNKKHVQSSNSTKSCKYCGEEVKPSGNRIVTVRSNNANCLQSPKSANKKHVLV
jgi:ribosomal protein L24E